MQFLIGLFVGVFLGLVISALCRIAGQGLKAPEMRQGDRVRGIW